MLMFIRAKPFFLRLDASEDVSSVPLVTIEISLIVLISFRSLTISTMSFLMSGSPPVNLILEAPNSLATLANLAISLGIISLPLVGCPSL
jgi:hypothetical protein